MKMIRLRNITFCLVVSLLGACSGGESTTEEQNLQVPPLQDAFLQLLEQNDNSSAVNQNPPETDDQTPAPLPRMGQSFMLTNENQFWICVFNYQYHNPENWIFRFVPSYGVGESPDRVFNLIWVIDTQEIMTIEANSLSFRFFDMEVTGQDSFTATTTSSELVECNKVSY